MPIVFVHGVATRRGAEYEEAVTARNALFRRYVYDRLGLASTVPVTSAYWGDDAARFRWNHASVPAEGVESFGPATPLEDAILAEFVEGELDRDDRALVAVAEADPECAFDLLWSAAAIDADDEMADALASLAYRASQLLPAMESAELVAGVSNDEEMLERLVEILRNDLEEEPDDRVESFGGDQILDRLSEGMIRIQGAAGRLSGRGATKLLRSKLHENGALFLGDVMTYLNERGETADDAGPIASRVMAAIDQAILESPDGRLVIVAHSMGGNISYDVLSHFRPTLECELFLTVGSQVGLFEELCLLAKSKQQQCPDVAKVPALPNVKRWINVFDYNDVLGFAAEKIFDGVEDFKYSTGKGVVKAHTSYFFMPSFYRRLADRIGG
jgi:broad specificity phosphatase PhoE